MRPRFRFKRADREERESALQLRDRIYREETGHAPFDDLDDRAIHLVALESLGVVVAASRIVGPECRPFEFERHVSLAPFVDPRVPIGLVGRFCVAHEFRHVPDSLWLHLGMLKLMYLVAKKERLASLVMYTFDHLLTFYRGAYFEPLNVAFFHSGYGQEMHLMRLDVDTFERQHLGKRGRLTKAFESIEASD